MGVDIVIPSLGKKRLLDAIISLTHIPFEYRLHVVLNMKFEEGINEGIRRSKRDLLFMDDDVILTENTFNNLEEYKKHADIIGFKLCFPNGLIQHGGISYVNNQLGHYGYMQKDEGQCDTPQYVIGVTGALIYVKRHVIETIGGYATDYTGVQFVDVDFCLRAIRSGFRILYVPNMAIHDEQFGKNSDMEYLERLNTNYQELRVRHLDQIHSLLLQYPTPCLI
jgi:GT2 family glycosyltransferase